MVVVLLAAALAVAVAAPTAHAHSTPRASPASSGHCLDSFLPAGQLIAPPADVLRGVQHTKPDRIVRVDVIQAKSLSGDPIVGFLYVTEQGSVFFSTRRRANIEPRVAPLIREIFAAASTATSAQLTTLLSRQDGNALLYLTHPMFLKRLPLRALPCVVLSRNAR